MKPYYHDEQVTLWLGDTLETLRGMPDESVNCVVTSPPYYGLRNYGVEGQYGLEATPAQYVETMRAVFAESRRVLAKDGTCWINIDDSYASGSRTTYDTTKQNVGTSGHAAQRAPSEVPGKNLLGIPWRLAFALQDDGWFLRNDVIWHKPNAMPESVGDRLTTRYEHLFLLARSERYWFDLDAVRESSTTSRRGISKKWQDGYDGSAGATSVNRAGWTGSTRNPGDVWSITTRPFPEAHFATFPIELPIRCIKAGCKPGGTVLDPFSGSGTTGAAARLLGRKYVGIDLNPAYHDLAAKRFAQGVLDFEAA